MAVVLVGYHEDSPQLSCITCKLGDAYNNILNGRGQRPCADICPPNVETLANDSYIRNILYTDGVHK